MISRLLVPKSLAGRTALVLVFGLMVVQIAGLLIHALDRIDLQHLADARDLGGRVSSAYRAIVAAPDQVRELDLPGLTASIEPRSSLDELRPASPELQELIRPHLRFGATAQPLRPREIQIRGGDADRRLMLALRMADDRWAVLRTEWLPPRPWHSQRFLLAFIGMTAAAALLTLWAVRQLTAPVALLGRAAERLGRDVNAPPLPEDGPTEVATAAAAFNTMAARIRQFVSDRTFLIAAIGHDLRTPITRLKLRAEWMEDDEQRRKMLADLDELEALVSATLAFGRDVAGSEPVVPMDLVALVRTVLDDAADARPDAPGAQYDGPAQLRMQGRPVALKRAFANLVGNGMAYAGSVAVRVAPSAGLVAVTVDDEGPGIPPEALDRVFDPFFRLETSRNRETGGAGLGLSITRNILRAHGGDVALSNRAGGGLRATVTLPA